MFKANKIAPSAEEAQQQLTKKGFLAEQLGTFTALNICAGVYLAGLLQLLGFSTTSNGIVLAIPVLGALFQIVGPFVIAKIKNERRFLILGSITGKLCLALVFFVPLVLGTGPAAMVTTVTVYTFGHIMLAMITPAMNNWLMVVTPPRERNSFFTLRERVGLGSLAVVSLLGSALLDYFATPQTERYGFAVIGGILISITTFNAHWLLKLSMPPLKKEGVRLKALFGAFNNRSTRLVLLMMCMWQFAAQFWIPHNSIYIIEHLQVNYSLLGIITVVTSVQKILLTVVWHRFISRTNFEVAMFTAALIYASCVFYWLIATPQNGAVVVVLHHLTSSVAWAIIGVALFNVQYDNLGGENKVLHMGLIGGVSGVAGFFFSLLGGFVAETVDAVGGLFTLNGQQVIIIIGKSVAVAMAVLIYFKLIPKGQRPTFKVYREFIGSVDIRFKRPRFRR